MVELVAENPFLRLIMLVLLFAFVATAVWFVTQAVNARQLARERLLEPAIPLGGSAALSSLRTERIESAWLKLVNTIENRGLSLVDTKDVALRQKLIAAGYPAPYAPRVYTL